MNALTIRQYNWWIILILTLIVVVAVNANGRSLSDNQKQKEVLTPLQIKMQKTISVDFKETPIDDVIRSMAAQADIDIIKSPKVIGEVTATLTDIPLDEALNNILSTHGYAYIHSKNMIRIVPIAEATAVNQKMVTKVYRITYANVSDVHDSLRNFVAENGSITFNQGTSNIMVTTTEDKAEAVDKFIKEVDRMTTQIMVEARLYDITVSDTLDLGVEWTVGRRSAYDSGVGTLGGASGKTDPFTTGVFQGTSNLADATNALVRFGILNSSVDIDAIIRAEQENIQAKLLANPKIMVLDNHEALIKIVEEIPFQELTETSAGGSIGTTEFREVGVELLVIPHVTRDDMIRLELYPQFSTETRKVVIPGINNDIPQPVIARREAQTTTLIKNGETVVIGGLRKEFVAQSQSKIPLLGDLPLLGGLFKFESEKVVNSELVIFITPHIVKRTALSPLEMQQLRDTNIRPRKTPFTRKLKTDHMNKK